MFNYTRIYTDQNGDSRFEDKELALNNAGDIGSLSERIPVGGLIFRSVKPTYDYDFHNAPQRQFIFLLDGEIEIETSLGEKRRFKGGDVLLAEDTHGKGHKTRNLKNIERRSAFLLL